MTDISKIILVTGATGRQGGAVVRHLLKNNFKVKAMSRTPGSIQAQSLSSQGVDIVEGDMSNPDSLVNAMKECHGVFSVQNFFEYGAEKEIRFGKNMVDAARRSDIRHFIYSSVCNAGDKTGVPHFETKKIIEKYAIESGLPATIVRPVKFMENYYIPQVFKGILGGRLIDAIAPGKKHQLLASDDIGAYTAALFKDPDKFIGLQVELAGDELTNEEIGATMSEVLGRKIKFKRLPLFIARLAMNREMYLMFKWFNKRGFDADMDLMKKNFPDIRRTSLRQWLISEGWQRWNKKGTV